jgi:hypothetical protein
MTDLRTSHGSHLVIWAMAEARRLRREQVRSDSRMAHPSSTSKAPGRAEERSDHVVEWQLPAMPACHSTL